MMGNITPTPYNPVDGAQPAFWEPGQQQPGEQPIVTMYRWESFTDAAATQFFAASGYDYTSSDDAMAAGKAASGANIMIILVRADTGRVVDKSTDIHPSGDGGATGGPSGQSGTPGGETPGTEGGAGGGGGQAGTISFRYRLVGYRWTWTSKAGDPRLWTGSGAIYDIAASGYTYGSAQDALDAGKAVGATDTRVVQVYAECDTPGFAGLFYQYDERETAAHNAAAAESQAAYEQYTQPGTWTPPGAPQGTQEAIMAVVVVIVIVAIIGVVLAVGVGG